MDYSRPIAVDLFTGLHGWAVGLVAAGWRVIGYDIVDMCKETGRGRPDNVELVLQDVATISGYPMRGKVQLIVASPPCQRYSYMAMPWKRAKAQAAEIRADHTGAKLAELNALFNHCFRIAREADCPLIVENVRGAQPWVGRAKWNYGSFYLWGDVPPLMPMTYCAPIKVPSASGRRTDVGNGVRFTSRDCGIERKQPIWFNDDKRRAIKNGGDWFGSGANCSLMRSMSSRSNARKEASARIAMIPFDLARHIGEVFLPERKAATA